jgi:hypothetical protein
MISSEGRDLSLAKKNEPSCLSVLKLVPGNARTLSEKERRTQGIHREGYNLSIRCVPLITMLQSQESLLGTS